MGPSKNNPIPKQSPQIDLLPAEDPPIATESRRMFAGIDDRTGASQQQATRLAARLNASTASDEEHKNLLSERQRLLDGQLNGTITRREEIRLEYIRWSLDRIEDAKHGFGLDRLQAHIGEIERVSEQLEGLMKQLNNMNPKANSKRR